jgi:hypothetical protein
MKKHSIRLFAGILFLGGAVSSYAQGNYPRARPRATSTAAGTPSATPNPGGSPATGTPSATPGTSGGATASPTARMQTGPLKMITTDGTNKNSPIRVTELNYYDEGYGSKYNSEVRVSGAVQNTGKTELKKVVVRLQIVPAAGDNPGAQAGSTPSPSPRPRQANAGGDVLQEWKENPGTLKPGQTYRVSPAVWRNSLGTVLKARMIVEHEEAVEKDAPK